MKFQILYCKPCGYRERAEALAVELRERFGARVEIEEGGFGQFDVSLEGELVASKGGLLRRVLIHGAPPHARIMAAIERAVAARTGDACAVPDRDLTAAAAPRTRARRARARSRARESAP